MGGGVGISFHGSHRVLTENAVFAMPEVGIGFFPDVGGSHLLPDLGGSFGLYLGLTGNRIRNGDALWSGLATHTIQAGYLAGLIEDICESGEPGTDLREVFRRRTRETDRRRRCAAIARHFSSPTLGRTDRGEPGTGSGRRTTFAAETLDSHAREVADQPCRHLPRDHAPARRFDGRVHAHGVPHPEPHAARA